MKYLCLDCGEIFDQPSHWEECHGFDHGPFEHFSGCPYCGEAYVGTHKCDCCGEWITGNYIKTEDGQRICEGCYIVMEIGDED